MKSIEEGCIDSLILQGRPPLPLPDRKLKTNLTLSKTEGAATHKVDCDKGEFIQKKIDNAKEGDVIKVSGTCNENLHIPDELHGITLDGQGSATIDGADSSRATIGIKGKSITVRGFTITGGRDGINITNGNVLIDGNIIKNTRRWAICVSRKSSAEIFSNTIQNNPEGGIILADSSAGHVGVSGLPGERIFFPNTIVQNGVGIEVLRNSEATIAGNTISNNTFTGIYVIDNSRAHIGFPDDTLAVGANTIKGNAGPGVFVARSSFARIMGNTISTNSLGIRVNAASHALISKNLIDNNDRDGITVAAKSSVSLGRDTATTLFDEPNETTVNNGGFGIRCLRGGIAKGRIGTLNGHRGAKGSMDGCIDSQIH
jgi:parallel beta-helix repeat protein